MKYIILSLTLLYASVLTGQVNQSPNKILETGKTLVEIIKVLKPAKNEKECLARKVGDLCFKNETRNKVKLSVFQRNDSGYVKEPFRLVLLALTEECFFELAAGVYKYQIDILQADGTIEILKIGEVKMKACERTIREITTLE
jgi:hypothetical protein